MSFFIQYETQFLKYSGGVFTIVSFRNGASRFEFYNSKGIRDVSTGKFLKVYFGTLVEVSEFYDNDPYTEWVYDGTNIRSGNLYYIYIDGDNNVLLDLYKYSTFKIVFADTNPIPIVPTNIIVNNANRIKLTGDLLFYGGQYIPFGYFNSYGGCTIYVKFSTYGTPHDSETIFYRHGPYYGYVPPNWETSLKRVGTSDQFRILIRQNYNYHIHQAYFTVVPDTEYTVYISIGDNYVTTDSGVTHNGTFQAKVNNLDVTTFIDENNNSIPISTVDTFGYSLTTDGPYDNSVDILLGGSRNDNDPLIYQDFLYGGEITEFQFYAAYVSYNDVTNSSNVNISTSNIWGPYSKTQNYQYIISSSNYYIQNNSSIEYETPSNIFVTLDPIVFIPYTYDSSKLFTIYLTFKILQNTNEIINIRNEQGGGIRIYRYYNDTFYAEVKIGSLYIANTQFSMFAGYNTIIIQNGIDFDTLTSTMYFFVNNSPFTISDMPYENILYRYSVSYDTQIVTDYRFYNKTFDIVNEFGAIYKYTGNAYTLTPNGYIYGDFINLDTKTYISLNKTDVVTSASNFEIVGSKDGIFYTPTIDYSNDTYRFLKTIFTSVVPSTSTNYWTNGLLFSGYLEKGKSIWVYLQGHFNGPIKYSVNNGPYTLIEYPTGITSEFEFKYTAIENIEFITLDMPNAIRYSFYNFILPLNTYIPDDISTTQINHVPKGFIQSTFNAAIDDTYNSRGIQSVVYEKPTSIISSIQSIQNVTNFNTFIDFTTANAVSFSGFSRNEITLNTDDSYTINRSGDYYNIYIENPSNVNIYGISNGYTVSPLIDTTPVETVYISEYRTNGVFIKSRRSNVFTPHSSSHGATWVNNGTNQPFTLTGNCTFSNAITTITSNINYTLHLDGNIVTDSIIFVKTDYVYTFEMTLTNLNNIPDDDVYVNISSIQFKGDLQVNIIQLNNSFTQNDSYTSIGYIQDVSLNNGELSNGMTLFWTNNFQSNPLVMNMNVFNTGTLVQSLSTAGNGTGPALKFSDGVHTFDLGSIFTENTTYTCNISWSPDSSGLSPILISNTTSYIVNTVQLNSMGASGNTGPITGSVYSSGVPNWVDNSFSVVDGVQIWNLPYTMTLNITVAGANGTNGGLGTIVSNTFIINHNDYLKFVVGQIGTAGGGGGSFVMRSIDGGTTYLPLIIAGGGGYSSGDNALFTPTFINNDPTFQSLGPGGGWGGGMGLSAGGGMNPGTSYDSTNTIDGTATAAPGTTGYNTVNYGYITITNQSSGPTAFNYIVSVTPTINSATISINYLVYSPSQSVNVFISNTYYNVYSQVTNSGTLSNPSVLSNLNPGWTYSVYSYVPVVGSLNSFGDPTYSKTFTTNRLQPTVNLTIDSVYGSVAKLACTYDTFITPEISNIFLSIDGVSFSRVTTDTYPYYLSQTGNLINMPYILNLSANTFYVYMSVTSSNISYSTATSNIITFTSNPSVIATGGTITTPIIDGVGYTVHTFTDSSSTFTILDGGVNVVCDILIVGGGGAGGGTSGPKAGGGGGSGGYQYLSRRSLAPGSYSVTVGSGGVGNQNQTGASGGNSIFGSFDASIGGGGGAGTDVASNGGSGGSGGGVTEGGGTSGTGAYNQGGPGGDSGYSSGGILTGSGGGGCGSFGINGSGSIGGTGGIGVYNTITGSIICYGGGGGGGAYSPDVIVATGGIGGIGGGGTGGFSGNVYSANGGDATYYGGGGGGGSSSYNSPSAGGNGYNGIVIVRYENSYLFDSLPNTVVSYTNGLYACKRLLKSYTGPIINLSEDPTIVFLSHFDVGPFIDTSMYNATITGNSTISTTTYKFGTGSLFLSNTSTLSSTSNGIVFGSNNFTVEFWLNFTSPIPTQTHIIGTVNGWLLWLYNGTQWVFSASNFSAVGWITGVITGSWNHYALVRYGNVLRFYLNGVLVQNQSYGIGVSLVQGGVMQINSNVGFTKFTGYMDELRITVGKDQYTGNFTAPTTAFTNPTRDYYSDSLGNLTSGMGGSGNSFTLSNAYVYKWYDQSYNGNHAISSGSVGTLPVYDSTYKRVDFKSSYLKLAANTIPYGNSNYTVSARHGNK